MDIKEKYRTNKDFKRYVDRYAVSNRISAQEALRHKFVILYLEYLEKKERGQGE